MSDSLSAEAIGNLSAANNLTIRDYLAAHAPAKPDNFFGNPPPFLKDDPTWKWCEGCKADDDCLHDADCDKLRSAQTKRLDQRDANLIIIEAQWRYAFADAMLDELVKPKG